MEVICCFTLDTLDDMIGISTSKNIDNWCKILHLHVWLVVGKSFTKLFFQSEAWDMRLRFNFELINWTDTICIAYSLPLTDSVTVFFRDLRCVYFKYDIFLLQFSLNITILHPSLNKDSAYSYLLFELTDQWPNSSIRPTSWGSFIRIKLSQS